MRFLKVMTLSTALAVFVLSESTKVTTARQTAGSNLLQFFATYVTLAKRR
jgi:hypothetical protein